MILLNLAEIWFRTFKMVPVSCKYTGLYLILLHFGCMVIFYCAGILQAVYNKEALYIFKMEESVRQKYLIGE